MGTRRILIIFVLVIILLVLTGCSAGYGELKGYIVDKKYRAAFTTVSTIYTGKVVMPVTQYHPEHWRFQIQKEENRRNKNNMGECFRECI